MFPQFCLLEFCVFHGPNRGCNPMIFPLTRGWSAGTMSQGGSRLKNPDAGSPRRWFSQLPPKMEKFPLKTVSKFLFFGVSIVVFFFPIFLCSLAIKHHQPVWSNRRCFAKVTFIGEIYKEPPKTLDGVPRKSQGLNLPLGE